MPQEHLFKQNAVPTAQPNPWVPADCGSLAKITVFGAVKSYLEKAHRVENAISQISLITQKSILASLREKRKHKVHGRFHTLRRPPKAFVRFLFSSSLLDLLVPSARSEP